LLLAVLNTDPASGSAELASAVIRESLARGGRAYRPRIASPTLGATFIDPALAYLKIKGASVTFGARLRGLGFDGKLASLDFADGPVALSADDRVVLATPAWVTKDLIPDVAAPTQFCAIVNAHFAMPAPGFVMDKALTMDGAELEAAIAKASDALLAQQRADGHWVFELEADATIPAEYVLLVHYLGETPNLELEKKIGTYLRRIQGAHGGWPLYHDGAFDISATVKAYFALKMIGDPTDAPHMARAREAILARGGALKTNVFTRIQLALFGETRGTTRRPCRSN
jgi:hypothetical protein